jgi:hypothetical protein
MVPQDFFLLHAYFHLLVAPDALAWGAPQKIPINKGIGDCLREQE